MPGWCGRRAWWGGGGLSQLQSLPHPRRHWAFLAMQIPGASPCPAAVTFPVFLYRRGGGGGGGSGPAGTRPWPPLGTLHFSSFLVRGDAQLSFERGCTSVLCKRVLCLQLPWSQPVPASSCRTGAVRQRGQRPPLFTRESPGGSLGSPPGSQSPRWASQTPMLPSRRKISRKPGLSSSEKWKQGHPPC